MFWEKAQLTDMHYWKQSSTDKKQLCKLLLKMGILRVEILAHSRGLSERECWSKQTLPLFFLQLNLVCMWHLLQLQEDIWILRVYLILLVLSLTWYLCAIHVQNTPVFKRHWSPSVAGACAWGQYLCCSITILVNFLTLTCCFKISYNMHALELDSLLSLSTQQL